jgi:hypothetical protein
MRIQDIRQQCQQNGEKGEETKGRRRFQRMTSEKTLRNRYVTIILEASVFQADRRKWSNIFWKQQTIILNQTKVARSAEECRIWDVTAFGSCKNRSF